MKRFLSMILCAALLLTNLVLNTPQKVQALEAQSNSKPNYVGTVKLDGDSTFDSDSIVNSDETQWRWLSYPESRIIVNPGSMPKYDGGMNLNLGLFVNGVKDAKSLQKIQMSTTGQSAHDWTSLSTAWYPYKLTAHTVYGTDGTLDMSEFFVDKNTFVRYIEASGVAGKTMTMSANTSGISILADHSILVTASDYYFVYKVMLLNDDSSVNQIIKPTISGSTWTATIPFTAANAKVAFSLTIAAKVDDSTSATAVSRSDSATSGKLTDKLAVTKAYWDEKLRKVPAPTVWGIQGGMDAKNVTAGQHKRSFYAAWAFNYQNILEPTPETGYNYYQVTLGKASMYTAGPSGAPNSCSWESMFDIQQLAMLEPDIAWNAAEGFINSIDDNGMLSGECLPSQKAHTVWVCYENKKDDAKLAELYPKIKKYLQWRFNNPHWGIGGRIYPDEKDISFVMQWYSDVSYAIKMCQVLGKYDDIAMWENLKDQMSVNAKAWFFTPAAGDPVDKIYNFYFTDSGLHYGHDRQADVPNYIASALYADFPKDLTDRLVNYYLNLHDSSADLIGFDFYKYGDGCHIAYALLEREKQYPQLAGMWKEYINAALRNVVKSVEFSEESRPDKYYPQGVQPSTFTASTMIDFTYMNNGMRIDLGAPVAIANGDTGLQTTADSNVTVYTIQGTHPNLPKTVSVKDKNGAALEAYVNWDTITEDQYASAGTVTVNGKVADTDLSVTATIKVYGGTVAIPSVTVKTVSGIIPILPTSATATYQEDGNTQNCIVSIKWDAMTQSDFATPGTVKVGGTIGFNGQKVEATVQVIDAAGIISSTGKYTVKKGDTLQLSLKDSNGIPLSVTWGIENPGYDAAAGISQNGTLLGVKAGTVTVTAQIDGVSTLLKKDITVENQNVASFAYGGTATASSQADTARSPAQAIDEDVTSMWRSANNNDNQSFQLAMKQNVPITGVKIQWFEGNQPQAIELKVSNDGSNWKSVYSRSVKIDTGKNDYSEVIALNQPESAKYVKIESTKAGNFVPGIIEFQVFGAPAISIPVQSVQITTPGSNFNIDSKGVTLNLGTTVTPSGASDSRVEWKVVNVDGSVTDKASISPAGILTSMKNGTVLVTATAVDGSGAKATQTVTMTNQDVSNVALNKPATATTNGGGENVPSAAVDGNRSTRWGSKSGAPQQSEFRIDLQGEYIISTVALYFDSGAYPVDYKLQYSMDGSNWSDIQNITGSSDPSKTFIFNPIHAKYVRTLSSKTTNNEWGYSIWEFEVYGKAIAQKTDLQKLYNDNKDKANSNYTEATWNAFQQALHTVNTVLQNADAAQDEVDGAYTILQQAVSGLKTTVDKTALQKLYNDNKDKANSNYTEATWNAFQQALHTVNTVLQNADAAQSEVDGGYTTLQQAISGLKTTVDKTALQKLYDDNKDKANSNYTEATWNTFQQVLHTVNTVLQNADAAQDKVDGAYTTLQQAVSGLKTVVDKTALQKLYDDNKDKANSNYTEATWNAFQQALHTVNTVLQNADAAQDEVDGAYTALQQAISGLKTAVDKTALQKLYDDNKDKANSNYTEATWNAFQQALNAAKAVLQNVDALQGQIDSAKAALDSARKGLSVKELPQPQAVEIKHEETGVTVTAPANVLPEGASLHVDILSQGNGFQLAQNALSDVGSKLKVLDIYLLLTGKVIQPDGTITVRIPIPAGFDKTRLALYYIAADGKKTQLPIQIDGNEVVFHTTHFSTYALVETAASSSSQNGSNQNSNGQQTGGQSPQTGEAPLTVYFIVGAAAAFAVIVLLSRRKISQKQK